MANSRFLNTYVEEIIEFDSQYAPLKHMVNQSSKLILVITKMEDEGLKDRKIAEHYGTSEYAIFCNN